MNRSLYKMGRLIRDYAIVALVVVVLNLVFELLFNPVSASVPNGCIEIGEVNGAYVGYCVNPENGDAFYFGPGQIMPVE